LAGEPALRRKQFERTEGAYVGIGGPPQNAVPTQERETPGADGIREVRSEKPHPGSDEPQEHYRAD